MEEKAKRLKPTAEVLRELYLKSGNQCAFPGCYEAMVDDMGNFIGQVCHIEAAEEGGERFNPYMTNEDRRAYDNLMLMCYKHHITTNDVEEYTVSKLKQMKMEHEAKFSGIIQEMQNPVIDYTMGYSYLESKTCQALSDTMEYDCTDEENRYNAQVLNSFLAKIIDLSKDTRRLLGIMVYHSFQDIVGNCLVPLHEVEYAISREASYIVPHIEILGRKGIVSQPYNIEDGCPICTLYGDVETGWGYCNDIREFCKRAGISVISVFEDLNFSVFD